MDFSQWELLPLGGSRILEGDIGCGEIKLDLKNIVTLIPFYQQEVAMSFQTLFMSFCIFKFGAALACHFTGCFLEDEPMTNSPVQIIYLNGPSSSGKTT
ncbi:MAG: hypothetical protein KGR16_01955 [Verrucomicrobia bacterium]|nr:hypothetical protein [Verrucomicrobiota bacterium]MDE3046903.1 hypothetical protein [Verrucomicrobiota bacterium]